MGYPHSYFPDALTSYFSWIPGYFWWGGALLDQRTTEIHVETDRQL